TVVGVDGAREEALLSEDGAVEAGAGDFSVEPFLGIGGRLIGWNDVTSSVSLADRRLPIPSVEWRVGDVALPITAFAAGPATGSAQRRSRQARWCSISAAASSRGSGGPALRSGPPPAHWRGRSPSRPATQA